MTPLPVGTFDTDRQILRMTGHSSYGRGARDGSIKSIAAMQAGDALYTQAQAPAWSTDFILHSCCIHGICRFIFSLYTIHIHTCNFPFHSAIESYGNAYLSCWFAPPQAITHQNLQGLNSRQRSLGYDAGGVDLARWLATFPSSN
jgi:hypothetical protein